MLDQCEEEETSALKEGNQTHKRVFKNLFKREDKSPRKLSSTKQHSLLYRLFHAPEDDEEVHESHTTLKCVGSDTESESSGPGTPKTGVPSPLGHPDSPSHFSVLPPPLLLTSLAIGDTNVSSQKSSSSLANFFKKEIRRDRPHMFAHLKTNERIEAELASMRVRAADVSSSYVCVQIPPFKQAAEHSPVFNSTKRNTSELSLSDKYGWVEKKCIGKGANGVVKVSHKLDQDCEKLYAIKKEFRKKNKDESDKSFIKKLTSEFCIGSSLHHENVVETIDLIKNDNQQWCEVLEYCGGGDLCHVIQNKHLTNTEVNTFFLQLIHGVAYIHKMGVSHRDLKPENRCLKIADFGEAEVFRSPYEKTSHKSKRCCGSQPYMAPEEFTLTEFESVPIDIFACGVIYLAMTYNRLPWRKPTIDDTNFKFYCAHLSSGFAFIDRLMPGPRGLMRRILHPDPNLRATMEDILGNEWFMGIEREYSMRDVSV